jgi:tetratricopeptide (TPR) repeat protein
MMIPTPPQPKEVTEAVVTTQKTCQGTAFNALLQSQFAEIDHLVESQQLEAATLLLKTWQAESPEEGAYAFRLGQLVLTYSQEPEKAKALFDLAVQADSSNASYWIGLAQASVALKEDAPAFQMLKKALELNPDNPQAFAILAPLLQAHGYTEEAVSTYEQWLSVQPELTDVYMTLAQLYQAANQPEEALQTLERATLVQPENPLLFFLKGALLQATQGNQSTQAQQAYETALALGGNQLELHEAIAQFYTQQLDYTKAIQHWVAVLELQPEAVAPLQALATLLQQLGRTSQSMAVLNKLLALNPNDARTHLSLAHAFSVQGLVDEALFHYNQAFDTCQDVGIELRKLFTVPIVHPSRASITTTHHRVLMGLKALSLTPFQLENPLVQVGDTPFYLLQQGEAIKPLLEQYHTLLQKALPPVPTLPQEAIRPKVAGVRRVGVVSRSFQAENKTAWAIQGLFAQLPQQDAETIELVFFSVGQPLQWVAGIKQPNPDSSTKTIEVTEKGLVGWDNEARGTELGRLHLVNNRNEYRSNKISTPNRPFSVTSIQLSTTDWEACQAAILAENLDVLLYTDVNQDPVSTFLAHRRLVPQQGALSLSGLTTGCQSTLDFVLIPEMPHSTLDFSEARVLPCNPWMPLKRLGENTKLLKQEFGVLYDDIVWVLPQAPYRIGLEMDRLLAQALEAIPKAKLLVLAGEESAWQEQLQARWQASFSPEAFNQVIFLGQLREADRLQLLNVADLVLDSFPLSEPLTVLQALNYGTPILTLKSTLSATIVNEFSEPLSQQRESLLVASSPADWLEKLILLSASDALPALKSSLKQRALAYFSPLRHQDIHAAFWACLNAQLLAPSH